MNRYYKIFLLAGGSLTISFLTGCSGVSPNQSDGLHGVVYSKVRVPYTTDLNMTTISENGFGDQTVTIQEPFTGYGVSAGIKSNAIGDIAQKHGLSEVFFADVQTFSLLGVWTAETIYVYGRRNNKAAPEVIQ